MTQKSDARLARDAATTETKTPKTMAEIDVEYNQVCGMAGQTQYRLKVLEQELNMLNSKLYGLNQEAAKLNEVKVTETTTAVTTPVETIPSETL